MQVVHFGGADVGEWGRQGGKEASTGSVNEQATAAGAWGSVLLGTSGRWHRTCCAGGAPGGLILYFLPSLAEGCSRYHSLQTAPGARHDKARSQREAGPCRSVALTAGAYGQWNGQSCPRSAPFVAEGPGNFHSKNSRQGMSPNIKVCCSISPGE